MGMWVQQLNSCKPVKYYHSWKFCQHGCVPWYHSSHYRTLKQMVCLWDKMGKGQATSDDNIGKIVRFLLEGILGDILYICCIVILENHKCSFSFPFSILSMGLLTLGLPWDETA
uniref:Uncharacterized protein n=1 Tax=Kalanchoe fedtschenkoi TaxID=63787 RepID=A0A7N0VHA4_KALFE